MSTVKTNPAWKQIKAAGALQSGYPTASTSLRLMVYSGVMPASSIWNTSFNLATYASQLLVGWTSFNLQKFGNSTITFGTTPPAAVNATGTGTATWVVMCYGPTSFTTGTTSDYIIGEPSLTNDNGLLQLNTLNVIAGQSIVPVNFNILF
jgi:hypothetical protein